MLDTTSIAARWKVAARRPEATSATIGEKPVTCVEPACRPRRLAAVPNRNAKRTAWNDALEIVMEAPSIVRLHRLISGTKRAGIAMTRPDVAASTSRWTKDCVGLRRSK